MCVVGSGAAAAWLLVAGGVGIAGGGPGSVGAVNALFELMALNCELFMMAPSSPNVSPGSGMVMAHARRCFSKRRMWTGVGLSFSSFSVIVPFGVGKFAAAS